MFLKYRSLYGYSLCKGGDFLGIGNKSNNFWRLYGFNSVKSIFSKKEEKKDV